MEAHIKLLYMFISLYSIGKVIVLYQNNIDLN